MNGEMKTSLSDRTSSRSRALRGVVGLIAYFLLVPALLFVAAGTLGWPAAWVYTALLLLSTVGSRVIVWLKDPDLLRERARFTESERTKSWDRILMPIVALISPAAIALVSGLDHRFGWPPPVPPVLQFVSMLLVAAGYGLAVWAMVANRYFSSVARIQDDRGQVVVSGGPYRFVRHPSYAGALVAALALPLMVDAVWALVPGLGMGIALVIRTRLEDRMLQEGLAGYASYAATTRYRLIPGIW